MSDFAEYDAEEVHAVPLSVTEAKDKVELESQVSVAKRYPRKLEAVKAEIMSIVTGDPETAESCGYALTRGDKTITGPSTNLATIVSQAYGNMRSAAYVVEIGEKTVKCQAMAWDLEKNTASAYQVLRKITDKKGQKYSEDMIVVTANAAMSIARRNAIFAVVPRHVWYPAFKAAEKAQLGDLSTDELLNAKRVEMVTRAIEAFKVTEAEVFAALKVKSMEELTPEKITLLIQYGNSIVEGDSTVDQIFRPFKEQEANEAAGARTQSALDKLRNTNKPKANQNSDPQTES